METGLGKDTWAPPDERGGNRQSKPTTTAPHLDSTTKLLKLSGRCWPAATETELPGRRSVACNDSSWRNLSFAALDPAPKLSLTGIPC